MAKVLRILSRVLFGGPMRKMLTCTVALIALLAFLKYRNIANAIAEHEKMPKPFDSITTAKAEAGSWAPTLQVVGSLVPVEGMMLSAEQSGKVVKVAFESGAQVKAGDLLVQLDIAKEEGDLRSSQARLDLAKVNLRRAQTLRTGNAMSASAVDDAQSAMTQAEGEVASAKAIIAKKTITAPISGFTGIRSANVGQFLSEGAPIVPLYSYDRLYVNFAIPQQKLPEIAVGHPVRLVVDAYPTETFEAKITTINPQVDIATRNVDVQATLDNPGGKLRSGMFTRVQVTVGNEVPVIIIPQSGVGHAAYGDSVFVVENMVDPKEEDQEEYLGVRQQFVKLGEKRGDMVAVLEGLKVGEEIASSGIFKLRPMGRVKINNDVKPGSELNPHPANT